MLKDWQDAFGHEIHDYFKGKGGYEIIERDDGFFSISTGPKLYFLEYEEWPASEQEAMKYVRGKVLDVAQGDTLSICKTKASMSWALTIRPSP